MTDLGRYVIDETEILRKAYRLLCLFFANKEISRRSDPDDPHASLASLKRAFFPAESTTLPIEIATLTRLYDDQMNKIDPCDSRRARYEQVRRVVDKYKFGLFDDLNLTLRETRNKVIHSEVMGPHSSEGREARELDVAHLHGDGDRIIDWKHFNGYVRLAGTRGKRSGMYCWILRCSFRHDLIYSAS